MSADTDLIPALETVAASRPSRARAEVACWDPPNTYARRISIQGNKQKIWCHYVKESAYRGMQDLTNYAAGSKTRS